MTIFFKTNGNWETVTDVYLKENGSWVPVNQVWYKNEAQWLNVPPLAPTSSDDQYWLNVFSTPADPAYLFDSAYWVFKGGEPFFDPDPLYPGGGSGTIQVPYGCNRMLVEIYGQGGAGGSSSGFGVFAGGGGSGAIIDTDPVIVTEFEPINWSVSAPNTIATGNGADGADVTISWAGNVLTAGGGKGGFSNGTVGAGGLHSGSGPAYAAATKYDGVAGEFPMFFLNPWGRGGGRFVPGGPGGGQYYFINSLRYADGTPVAPVDGCGGGGGFNSYGQRGGNWSILMIFYYVP